MPIRPELKKLYPPNWHALGREVRARAGNCCEGSPKFPDCRAADGLSHPDTGSRVVLTVAHFDHDVTNNTRDNLFAWCQRCHLAHDLEQHMMSARKNRAAKVGQGTFPWDQNV